MVFAVGYVIDFTYNLAEITYKANNPEFGGLSGHVVSDAFALSDALTPLMELEIVLATAATIPLDVSVMVGIGITFYQSINSELYELARGSVMKVGVTR